MNIALSINIAPSSIVEKDLMLPEEIEIYNNILKILDDNKSELLDGTIKGEKKEKEEPLKKDNIMVRFVQNVPKFVGSDLEQYGPFQIEDIANLPKQLADILISKGNAEEIEGD